MFSFLLAQAEVSWAIRCSIFLFVHAAQERGVPLTELASFLRAADPFHHLQLESEVLCEHLHVTEFHTTPGSSISCLRQCSHCFPHSSAGTAEPQQARLVPVTLAGQNEKRNAKCSPNPPSLDRVNFFYAFYPFWLWNFNWISKCRSEATDHCRQSGLSPRSSLEQYVYNCADVIRISVQITKVEGTRGNQCYFPTVFQGFQLHCIFSLSAQSWKPLQEEDWRPQLMVQRLHKTGPPQRVWIFYNTISNFPCLCADSSWSTSLCTDPDSQGDNIFGKALNPGEASLMLAAFVSVGLILLLTTLAFLSLITHQGSRIQYQALHDKSALLADSL